MTWHLCWLVGIHPGLGDDGACSRGFARAGTKAAVLGGDRVLWGDDVALGIGCNGVVGIVSGCRCRGGPSLTHLVSSLLVLMLAVTWHWERGSSS